MNVMLFTSWLKWFSVDGRYVSIDISLNMFLLATINSEIVSCNIYLWEPIAFMCQEGVLLKKIKESTEEKDLSHQKLDNNQMPFTTIWTDGPFHLSMGFLRSEHPLFYTRDSNPRTFSLMSRRLTSRLLRLLEASHYFID